jgi:hypothetical protein
VTVSSGTVTPAGVSLETAVGGMIGGVTS